MNRSLRRSVGFAVALALAPGFGASSLHAQLAPVEQRVADYIDAHEEEAIELLERLVNINSGTLNPRGVRAVADVLAAELRPLGFDVRWVPMPFPLQRAGHLIAEREGTSGKRVLLIGHLDTVFEEDSPFQSFERDGDVARGPGVVDMKGGNVVIVQALKALHAEGALEDATIRVIFTGDEENPGRPLDVSRRDLIELGRRSDVALGFEGGSRSGEIEFGVVARRSSSGWTLRVEGNSAHSSGVFSPSVGAGAIFEASRILSRFYEEVRGEEYLTFNPGIILGGTDIVHDGEQNRGTAFGKTNVVAQTVVVQGEIRTFSDEQLERTRERMRRIVGQNLPGTRAEISFTDGYPSMPATQGNMMLLRQLNEINEALDGGQILPFDPARRGAADISFVASFVDALDGLGPHGSGSHTLDEALDLSTLPLVTKRAAILIHRLTNGDAVGAVSSY